MKIVVVCVGKTREGFIREGIEKYLRYLRPFADTELRELKAEKVHDLRDAPLIRKREAERILRAIAVPATTIALDERGEEFTSHGFAAVLDRAQSSGVREMTFVIGGSLGLEESVVRQAGSVLALSRWTLTHEMARLVLLEQVYRAFTIITGKTYHY